MVLASLLAPPVEPLPGGVEWWRGLVAMVIVIALLVALALLLRRGALGTLGRRRPGGISVDAVVPLGERRCLLVVTVEGRRLLLGASPVGVSLVTELSPAPSFESALARSAGQEGDGKR